MSPQDEDLIEVFARWPEQLTPAERDRAERRIKEDEAAASLFSFYSVFHKELNTAQRESYRRIEQFIRDIAPLPRSVRLQLYAPGDEIPPDAIAEDVRPGAILLTSGPDDENARVLINPAEDGYRVYTAAADNEVAAYGLFILPQAAITAPLDGGGRGTITLPEDRPVADLFEDAALLPAQHIETFESDALSAEPTSVVPGFRLRVRAAGEEVGWIPAVDTHTAETAYVVVRWADGDVICETNDPAGVVDLGSTIKSLTVSLHG